MSPSNPPSTQMLNTMGLPISRITVSYRGSSTWRASTLREVCTKRVSASTVPPGRISGPTLL